jgi:hypothetical protein
VGVVVGLHRDTNLLEVVHRLKPRRGFANLLNRRHKQADQDANDGNHHE